MNPQPVRRGGLPPSTRRKRRAEREPSPVAPPPPPKRGKPATPSKGTSPPAEDTEERRLKRYREHAPQSVMIKHGRVMTQRMFLVERSGRKNGELHEDFNVLGSTGNVYVVAVSQIPTSVLLSTPQPIQPHLWFKFCRGSLLRLSLDALVLILPNIRSIVNILFSCLSRSSSYLIRYGSKLLSSLPYSPENVFRLTEIGVGGDFCEGGG